MLFNEPKLLKFTAPFDQGACVRVSVLFNEPKLLKSCRLAHALRDGDGFSALQRAEIAEIDYPFVWVQEVFQVSVLFNEPKLLKLPKGRGGFWKIYRFSALQRAEIAEISAAIQREMSAEGSFSALQRAEIAEICDRRGDRPPQRWFQCSSTSRNC